MFNRGLRPFITIFLVVICTVFFTGVVDAEEKQFYLGVGGSYQLTNFENDDVVDWDSSAWGVNANFGYRLARTLYLQIDVDYIPGIEGALKTDNAVGGDVDVYTGIFSLKGYFPNFVQIKPFVIAGAGLMHYNADLDEAARASGYFLDDDNETSICFKVGGGVDVFIVDAFSIGLEGNYTAGIEDVSEVNYYNFILGAAYHF